MAAAGSTTGHEKAREELIGAAGGLLWQSAPNGLKIAVVHRSRYDDWALPKGKLKPGESWLETALREVKEETGGSVRVLSFAGAIGYETDRGSKVVKFWNMTLRSVGQAELDTSEVEQVVWLSPAEAIERLSYPLERAMVEAWEKEITLEPVG
jgi:8-oxo-dGTP pyrophosphatase MutT (NUDIX family)